MHFKRSLQNIFSSKAKAKLVGVLAADSSMKWTGAALAAEAGCSQPRAWKVLHELERENVVVKEQAGRAQLWHFNGAHIFASEILRISSGRKALVEMLRELLKEEKIPHLASEIILFGSVAKGEERHDSDIDLLLVVDRGSDLAAAGRAVSEVSKKSVAATGCTVVPVIITKKKFESLRNGKKTARILEEGIELFSKGAS